MKKHLLGCRDCIHEYIFQILIAQHRLYDGSVNQRVSNVGYRVLEFLTHDKGDHTPHLQPMAYPRYSIRERTYLITPLNL